MNSHFRADSPPVLRFTMTIRVSFDSRDLRMDQVYAWLVTSYWSPGIRRDVVERAFSNSLVASALNHDGQQVGVARVITDRATFAYLCDVFVDESHRGQGVGKLMVSHLLNHPDLQTVRHWALATRDAHSLYAGFGFGPVPEGRWMRKPMPNHLWQMPDHVPRD